MPCTRSSSRFAYLNKSASMTTNTVVAIPSVAAVAQWCGRNMRRRGAMAINASNAAMTTTASKLARCHVAAAEVQPQAELIERQRETDAVNDGQLIAHGFRRLPQEQVRADEGEQEDAVVQVMDVRAAQMKIDIRDAARHDEEDDDPGRDEGEEKGNENLTCATLSEDRLLAFRRTAPSAAAAPARPA